MDKLRNKATVPPEYSESIYVKVDNESSTCPTTLDNKLHVCPGYKVMEYDRFRFPSMMLQVHCKCNGCLGSPDKACVRLFYYTRVLRVTGCNKKGVYVYDYFWEKVSNGCVCIKNDRQTMSRGWERIQYCVKVSMTLRGCTFYYNDKSLSNNTYLYTMIFYLHIVSEYSGQYQLSHSSSFIAAQRFPKQTRISESVCRSGQTLSNRKKWLNFLFGWTNTHNFVCFSPNVFIQVLPILFTLLRRKMFILI